ncbi:uncharacterized protein LOC112572076 [Pomacea canaliculata]|uniref:uncharacterized protein LOC112572076 n=1 Tax=Pomacea canaliculata TaxID=400727 RepID=UPI000D728E78|nr:uncharacterized protein LOC112572076 [Pomacea canaliculata]XP_025107386.1 uncharacterized protein LOC112572076 [Pomacea canaliculata]
MYGAICNSRGPPRHSNPSHYTKEEISSGRPSLQSETRGNSNCNDVTYVEYCGASSGGSKPAASKSFISQDADRLAKEWTNFICKEVCLAEMDKNDSNEASDRCRDSVLRDQTKEEDPASDVRWPDTGCQEVYPAREAEEYCRATGDHYKCNATCAQLSGRGLHESTVEWPGSQFTEVCTTINRCQDNRPDRCCTRCRRPLSGEEYGGALRSVCDRDSPSPLCRYAAPDHHQESIYLRSCSRCDGFQLCNPVTSLFYDQTHCAKVCQRIEGARPYDAQVLAVIKHSRSVKITQDCTEGAPSFRR